MSLRVSSHLYRNRHGTYYFRFTIPKRLRTLAGQGELRFSLGTEIRQAAIISALPIIADLPHLVGCLQRMADTNESPPSDYFKDWQLQMQESAKLRVDIVRLKDELESQRHQIAGMVPRTGAKDVVKQAYTSGQLKGKKELELRLVFPWPSENTKRFSELLAAYMRSFTFRASGGRKKPPGAKTLDGYEKDIGFFITAMGDPHIGGIDRDLAGQYFNVLRRLPANISRKAEYRNKTIPELLELKAPPQSEYNASKKLERPSGMFKWALLEKRKWGIDANPFEGFGQSGDNATKRRPFTTTELLALLKHPDFVGRRFKNTYSFWLIPLAIFTGARLGELAQLDIKDFVVIDGIDCIDINDIEATEVQVTEGDRAKRVKTKNAKRLVPIHAELARIGLLRYVETLRQKGQVHLFPELSRTRRDGPAHAASNWFQRFRARVGILNKQETVFHSFRHGFITALLDGGTAPHLIAPIVGHEGELITSKVYWNVRDATKRQPTVNEFALPQELVDLLLSVEQVTFVRAGGSKLRKKIVEETVR